MSTSSRGTTLSSAPAGGGGASLITIPRGNFTWKGYSRAGEATCFVIPEWRWMFDCGRVLPKWRPTVICITHTHADHIHALPQIVFCHPSHNNNNKRIYIYVPAAALLSIRAYLQTYHDLIRDDNDTEEEQATSLEEQWNFQLYPVEFHQEIDVPPHDDHANKKKKNHGSEYRIRIVQCTHRKVCVGYSVCHRKMILKPEYQSLEGHQLGALHRSGISLKEWGPFQPLFCYLGDTTIQVLEQHSEILQHHTVIMIECTFWMEEDLDRSRRTQHMHWKDLQPHVLAHPNTLFILQHFSVKHSALQWLEWFREHNQMFGHYNVHPMLQRNEIEQEWNKKTKTQPPKREDIPTCNCFVCKPK
jgi:ribonuclease Z